MKFKDTLEISVKRLVLEGSTPEEFAREVCEMTFLGKSKISLSTLFKSEHSPVRTQQYWITFKNLPLFISTHFIRHHVGSIPFQLTCRDDRKGGNVGLKEKLEMFGQQCSFLSSVPEDELEHLYNTIDRYTPVNLGIMVNAQSLIDMFKLRLCRQSHKETIWVAMKLKEQIAQVTPELAEYLVPKCIYRGGLCGEPMACGWNKTSAFDTQLKQYVSNFNDKQLPKHFINKQ